MFVENDERFFKKRKEMIDRIQKICYNNKRASQGARFLQMGETEDAR
jgi:hypothetical protein